MLKTALKMREEILNPYLFNNPFKTVTEKKRPENRNIFYQMSKFQSGKIRIEKSSSAMKSTIFQLVYMPNFKAIRQSVWEKKREHTHKHTHTHTHTDRLEFYKDRWPYSVP